MSFYLFKTVCNGFTCNNGQCLDDKKQECDGIKSCTDNSDEHSGCLTDCNGFLCKDKEFCLVRSQFCDNYVDCSDDSDEPESYEPLGPYELPKDTEKLKTETTETGESSSIRVKYSKGLIIVTSMMLPLMFLLNC